MADATEYGPGITGTIKDGKLLLAIDLENDYGFSGSGKNVVIATTSGNQAIANGNVLIKLGINCFRAPTPAEKAAHLATLG